MKAALPILPPGREGAGGGQAPRAFALGNHVTSAAPGCTELAGGRPPRTRAEGGAGQVPGKLCKQPHRLPQLRPPHGHPSCSSQALLCQLRRTRAAMGRAVEAESTRKALARETGSFPCSAQRDPLPLRLRKEQGSARRGEVTLQPVQAVLLRKVPLRAHLPFEHMDEGSNGSVPQHSRGRQCLMEEPALVLRSRHCRSLRHPPVSAKVPISRAARHPQRPRRKLNTNVLY